MYKDFDLEYLGKDLTGNEELSSLLDRGLAFMKLEKQEKALQIFDEIIDKYPASPCGWFAKARLSSIDFTYTDLFSDEARYIVSITSDCLETAKKVVDEERKADYELLTATYSDKLKRALVECYAVGFNAAVDGLIDIARQADAETPHNVTKKACRLSWISEAMATVLYGETETETIYSIPEELIEEAGNDYCALRFATIHVKLFEEFLVPLSEAFDKQEYDQKRRDARAEMRSNWNIKQGWGSNLSASDIQMLDREFPVFDISYYYKCETDVSKYALDKLIKKYAPFTKENTKTFCLESVLEGYEKLYKLLELPLGDLSSLDLPEEIREKAAEMCKRHEEEKAQKQQTESPYEAEITGKERAIQERIQKESDAKHKKTIKFMIIGFVILVVYYLGQFILSKIL